MVNDLTTLPPEDQLLIYQDGSLSVQVRVDGETVLLTQKLMETLFDVGVSTINEHLKNIFASGELHEDSTIRKFRIVRQEGQEFI